MSDFTALQEYVVTDMLQPIRYKIMKIVQMLRTVAKYLFRQVPSQAASGYATIEQIEGNTAVWNQLVQNGDFSDGTNGWSSILSASPIVSVTDGILKITKNAEGGTGNWYANTTQPTYYSTHKYYIALDAWNEDGETIIGFAFYNANYGLGSNIAINVTSNTRRRYSVIGSPQTTGNKWTLRVGSAVTPMDKVGYFDNLVIRDLTAIFGSGNEPTTVADFEAWISQNIGNASYYTYNAGELISCKMESLKSIGFNQWDEEWEQGGISNGAPSINSFQIRSKNFIPILSNQDYCYTGYNYMWIYYYDADKNWIGPSADFKSNDVLYMIKTTPQNAKYIKFKYGYSDSPATTYNYDICINISDQAKNGTYKPYKTDSADIDVTTITGINPNTNVREVIFPQGMKQADREGTFKDTLDLRSDTATVRSYKIIDLSSLYWEWQSGWSRFRGTRPVEARGGALGIIARYETLGTDDFIASNGPTCCFEISPDYIYVKDTAYGTDANALRNSLSGVSAIVSIATPITYTDLQDANGNPLNPRYKVEQGGTEQVLPANTSTPTTVAPILTATYTIDQN